MRGGTNMLERAKNVFNALIGRKATCGGNCTCHSKEEFVDYDFSNLSPELQDAIEGMLSPEGLAEIQAELDNQNGEPEVIEPSSCVHLDYIPVCHCKDGDLKPDWCSASKCPVRMFQVALDEMNKKASMIAYG
jgi:hypothetical protein